MSVLTGLGLLFLLVLLSGAFSGSETGVYSLSRIRLDAESRQGKRTARILRRLVRDDTGLLITLLIGNNVVLELTTHLAKSRLAEWSQAPNWTRELLIALILTPVVFLFGEVVPKDMFRRRPHLFLGVTLPLTAVSRFLFLPLTLPLQGLSLLLERTLGIREQDFTRALGREEVLEILREGALEGIVAPDAEELARNVLVLRETPVEAIMLPWTAVQCVNLDAAPDKVNGDVVGSDFARLPAWRTDPDGVRRIAGYLHQLDFFREEGARDPRELLRALPVVEPDLPVDSALGSLRVSGQRLALVGNPERPVGLVTLMDLVATISGGGKP